MCPSGRSLASNSKTASWGLDFRTAFDVLDADHDGKISREDLKMFYTGLQTGVVEDEDDDVIGSMMSVADFNKDGFVEYDEFERVLNGNVRKNNGNNRFCNGVLEDAFKVMDKDGDGILSHEDLKSYLQLAGFEANDDDIKAMIKLGCNGNGEDERDSVSFDDLIKILCLDA